MYFSIKDHFEKLVLGHCSSQALSRIKKGNQSLSLFRLQLDNLSKDCFQTFLDAENSQKASKNRKIMIFPKQKKQNKNIATSGKKNQHTKIIFFTHWLIANYLWKQLFLNIGYKDWCIKLLVVYNKYIFCDFLWCLF